MVDFAELAKQWLPAELIPEVDREKLSSPLAKSFHEKRLPFFKEAGLVEQFEAVLEFLDSHREASFRRGSVRVNLLEHSLRTADFAFALTGSLPFEERAVVVLSALLHDAGKATVSEEEMRQHPEYSFEIASRLGLYNSEWDKVVKEADPLELQRVRLGNLIAYLVRYHHEQSVPAVDHFTADEAGTLNRLLLYLKRADSAAAKMESGEAKDEATALEWAIQETKKVEKTARRLEQEQVKKEAEKEGIGEEKLLQFFLVVSQGINQPADRRTPAKLYGYTMTARPLVALFRERVLEVAKGLLGTATLEELAELLRPFGMEDGRIIRSCIFKPYPNAAGRKEVFLVVNWEKIRKFAQQHGKTLPPFSNLERRLSRARISLVQE